MKILHISPDDKFVDQAFPVFEKVYPNSNHVLVFSSDKPLRYVKLKPNYVEKARKSFFNNKAAMSREFYNKYDVIIFHCLVSQTYSEVFNIRPDTPIIWIGWGGDYYPDLLIDKKLFLERTLKIYNSFRLKKVKRTISQIVKILINRFNFRTGKVRAIEKVTVFSPVLPAEYEMVKLARSWNCFPEFSAWNYGTLEDNLIRGFEQECVNGDAILVGNSATYTGNHAEAFDLLHRIGLDQRHVVSPLSYGDATLAKQINELGVAYFGQYFEPLEDFMPIEDYVAIIKKCGYVIMNHVRQQAVGNIVIMLYLGARVFVRRENPVYDFFKKSGVSLSTVQELKANPNLINTPLTEDEREINRAFVSDYWSRANACERTLRLVKKALLCKGVKVPAMSTELDL